MPELEDILKDLTELHTHLGSSVHPHILWELALEQGIRLPEKDYFKFIDSVVIRENESMEKYLNYFHLTEKIQSSHKAVKKAVHSIISHAYRKWLITTIEIRFNPFFRNRKGEMDLDKIILSANYGMKIACLEYPVKAGIILMTDRRLDYETHEKLVEKAIKYHADGVVWIDIAGPVKGNIAKTIQKPFLKAKEHGLGITIHTWETGGIEEMRDVVTLINPHRIGHGIKAVEDPKLLAHLAEQWTILELCPTSNIRTNAVKDWAEFKDIVDTLKKYEVKFTINSDGFELINTNVKKEFENLYQRWILTIEDIKQCKKYSREATFVK